MTSFWFNEYFFLKHIYFKIYVKIKIFVFTMNIISYTELIYYQRRDVFSSPWLTRASSAAAKSDWRSQPVHMQHIYIHSTSSASTASANLKSNFCSWIESIHLRRFTQLFMYTNYDGTNKLFYVNSCSNNELNRKLYLK